jgi:hypothetical protein
MKHASARRDRQQATIEKIDPPKSNAQLLHSIPS